MVVTDAKADTSQGRSKWSSLRSRRWPISVWISPVETNETIEAGLLMTAINMSCDDPTCSHELVIEQSTDGSYKQRRSCTRWWRPAVMIDKHWPSFQAVQSAGMGRPFLCVWHADKAFDEYICDVVGIKGDISYALTWAFRLLKRARSVAKARELRDEFARFVCLRVAFMRQAPWTVEQGEQLLSYIDRRWMSPPIILEAWIDAKALEQRDFFQTSGAAEASHAFWDKYMMNAQQNRSISKCIVKTVGVSASGKVVTGFLPNAQRRYESSCGQAVEESIDVRLRQHKAELVFLLIGPAVMEVVNGCVIVPHFNGLDDCLQRHALGADLRAGTIAKGRSPPFPSELQPMLEVLQHGGVESYRRKDKVSIDLKTGGCECLDNVWKGLVGAVPSCKHRCLIRLLRSAHTSSQAAQTTRQHAAESLRSFVHARERSKPAILGERCQVLYAASAPGVPIETLLQALKTHVSYPPSGKGIAAVCDDCTLRDEDEDEVQRASEVEAEEAVRLEAPVESTLSCTFRDRDMGIIFCADEADAVALRFAPLGSGTLGPADYTGDAIQPGDCILAVNGQPNVAKMLSQSGHLEVEASSTGIQLTFTHPSGRTIELDLGGRPGTKKAKFGAHKAVESKLSKTASKKAAWVGAASGGSPGVKAAKPQRLRAAEREPSTHRQRSAFEPQRPGESDAEARDRVESAFDELFIRSGQPLLMPDEQMALEGELAGATYIA